MSARGVWLLGWIALAICWPGEVRSAAPSCAGAQVFTTPDYQYIVGSAGFVSGGEAESGSTFRWLTNGTALGSGPALEDLLLHLDGDANGANGEAPSTAQSLAFSSGKWGSALSLPAAGRLQFSATNNFHVNEGMVEMWVALRAEGTNTVYSSDQVLFYYRGTNSDYLQVAQSGSSGILYAGGTVSNLWESAYGSHGSMRGWHAGDWHHLAFTYSVANNFMRFYVDGALTAQNNEGHYWAPAAGGGTVAIGGATWGATANYLVDEVRLSGRAADDTEIAARARRTTAPQANEVWLAATNLPVGREVVFEFTPASASQVGAACQSSVLTWNGLPITNAVPPSTLLAIGANSVDLLVETVVTTRCAYAVGQALPLAQMIPFASGAGTYQHRVTVTGLNPDSLVVNDVYVRCESDPNYLYHLRYRAVGECNPPFPRKGNLWGWGEWLSKGLPYMAKVDLWLGASPTADQVVALRQLNSNLRVLTSINTVENGGLPSDYYLKDVNGHRIEVWPGSYRLNLTKPYVADYQAHFAYQTVLDTGLMADGVFFDNVMTTQSWQTQDIYGNPVQIDANEDGIADVAATLDAAWKVGVFREIQTFRQLMPNAVVCGHSMNIYEPGISNLFNGLSIGFWTADTLEGRMGFSTLLSRYQDWLNCAVKPTATMVESSPMAQIGYGYDYSPWEKIPASTLEFARTYYPYVRFGLALTLLNDGYFAQEFGDTWHGNDWWYDELDNNLAYPLGPAERIDLGGSTGTNGVLNGGFESDITSPWGYWAATGCALTITRQATNAAIGAACARLDVTQTDGEDWHIEFTEYNRSLVQNTTYDLTFWARASAPRSLTLSSQKGSPDWRNYGLSQTIGLGTNWQQYTVTFTANDTVTDARLQFMVGATTGTVWLDEVTLLPGRPQVWRRDFNRGIALLNGTRQIQDVPVGAGFHRLTGSQAPFFETILDDQGTNFIATGNWTNRAYDSGLWKAAGSFYHSWAGTLHEALDTSTQARWQLPIESNDTYTVAAWWPAAPQATNWTSQAHFEILTNGVVAAATNLDQSANGDQWHVLGTLYLAASSSPLVRLTSSSGICVADALHVWSAARYNNGQPAASVRLQPMDGIILLRDQPVVRPPRFSSVTARSNQLTLSATNLTPGFTFDLERATNVAGVWRPITSFTPSGYATNLIDTQSLAWPGFYRLSQGVKP